MQNAGKMPRVELRLGADLKRDLEDKAEALGISLSAYVRAVMAAHATSGRGTDFLKHNT